LKEENKKDESEDNKKEFKNDPRESQEEIEKGTSLSTSC